MIESKIRLFVVYNDVSKYDVEKSIDSTKNHFELIDIGICTTGEYLDKFRVLAWLSVRIWYNNIRNMYRSPFGCCTLFSVNVSFFITRKECAVFHVTMLLMIVTEGGNYYD